MHSHVLPAFAFKWLKQSGHIRHSQTPNRRSQDGAKRHWLCRSCEDVFNSYETPFATHIFHPYDRNPAIHVRYTDWMLKFCVSVAWRSLLYLQEEYGPREFNERQIELAEQALQTWARYLRGEYKHIGDFEVHILPFGEIAEHQGLSFPPNINRYLMRAIEINAGSSESTSFVFSKLGPFAIFGFIELKHPKRWKGTRISERSGWFRPGEYKVPIELAEFLSERAVLGRQAMERISPTQQQKITEAVRANLGRFAQSGLFRAMKRDVEMFGSHAFTKYAAKNDDPT
ncbi:hypothetical protein [Bradyrhizobium sp. WYCCWR 12699]|uniref:hypothetical protein n=1 Tax=Bradyrhizobium sp. WYCCWR 12699 TaxID=3064203 RepID=UPI0028A49B23|nr:hypothetical protein [Bradyrhizobium sp. WYCCWR 12699]MDT4739242.1 hypothetical protein [Bradyrhizobium sp. WYCCWR 12699]